MGYRGSFRSRWEDLPLSVSIHGASSAGICQPVPGVLLLCDGGWLLLDTGFNTALITDPALRRAGPPPTPGNRPLSLSRCGVSRPLGCPDVGVSRPLGCPDVG